MGEPCVDCQHNITFLQRICAAAKGDKLAWGGTCTCCRKYVCANCRKNGRCRQCHLTSIDTIRSLTLEQLKAGTVRDLRFYQQQFGIPSSLCEKEQLAEAVFAQITQRLQASRREYSTQTRRSRQTNTQTGRQTSTQASAQPRSQTRTAAHTRTQTHQPTTAQSRSQTRPLSKAERHVTGARSTLANGMSSRTSSSGRGSQGTDCTDATWLNQQIDAVNQSISLFKKKRAALLAESTAFSEASGSTATASAILQRLEETLNSTDDLSQQLAQHKTECRRALEKVTKMDIGSSHGSNACVDAMNRRLEAQGQLDDVADRCLSAFEIECQSLRTWHERLTSPSGAQSSTSASGSQSENGLHGPQLAENHGESTSFAGDSSTSRSSSTASSVNRTGRPGWNTANESSARRSAPTNGRGSNGSTSTNGNGSGKSSSTNRNNANRFGSPHGSTSSRFATSNHNNASRSAATNQNSASRHSTTSGNGQTNARTTGIPPAPLPITVSLELLQSEDEVRGLTSRELKALLARNRVSLAGCIERTELVNKALALYRTDKAFQKSRLQNEEKGVEDRDLCIICCDNQSNCVFLECGHMVTCIECGTICKDCPMCRSFITKCVRVFRA